MSYITDLFLYELLSISDKAVLRLDLYIKSGVNTNNAKQIGGSSPRVDEKLEIDRKKTQTSVNTLARTATCKWMKRNWIICGTYLFNMASGGGQGGVVSSMKKLTLTRRKYVMFI